MSSHVRTRKDDMKRITQITTAEHSLLCNQAYLKLLRREMTQSDYVLCINTNTQLASDRLYRYHESNRIGLEDFSEAKSIITRVHTSYLKKGNIYG